MGRAGSTRPKSVQLLAVIEMYRGPLEYDWQTRFHLPLAALFDGRVSWHLGWLWTEQLLADPTTRVAQAASNLRVVDAAEWAIARGAQVVAHLMGAKTFEWPWPFERPYEPSMVAPDDAGRAANIARLNSL